MISRTVRAFDGIGVSLGQLEERQGKPSDKWTEVDVANLGMKQSQFAETQARVDEEREANGVTYGSEVVDETGETENAEGITEGDEGLDQGQDR